MNVATKVNLLRLTIALAAVSFVVSTSSTKQTAKLPTNNQLTVQRAIHHDKSKPLASATTLAESEHSPFNVGPLALAPEEDEEQQTQRPTPTPTPQMTPVTPASAAVEQKSQGTKPAAKLVESFDGLGYRFEGPQGVANLRNPSDNTLAVGPDHVVQIVNTRMAVFSKKGKRFDRTGKILYGPVVTRAVFAGFGGQCEARNNGDAVVRYDQLANRWLIVMPIFARGPVRPDQPAAGASGDPAAISPLDNQVSQVRRCKWYRPVRLTPLIQIAPAHKTTDKVHTQCATP
jgi:hypothetical protein